MTAAAWLDKSASDVICLKGELIIQILEQFWQLIKSSGCHPTLDAGWSVTLLKTQGKTF